MYEIAVTNLKLAREKKDSIEDPKPIHLQPGDTVLVQNHTKGPFDPKYIGDYRVVLIKGNQIEVRPSIGGPTEMKHVKHVKYIHPADEYIKHLPDYSTFGKKGYFKDKFKTIPDLHWQLADTYHTTNIGQSTLHVCTPSVDVNTLSFTETRKYNITGTGLHIDTTVINSNNDAIVSVSAYKTQ